MRAIIVFTHQCLLNKYYLYQTNSAVRRDNVCCWSLFVCLCVCVCLVWHDSHTVRIFSSVLATVNLMLCR